MNQDESTQSLSDKVLDRGNTLLFRKPESLAEGGERERKKKPVSAAERHLPVDTWLRWQKEFRDTPVATREYCERFVEQMSSLCEEARRPFGHRIADSIRAYVANHPDAVGEGGLRLALADMVEMRLLPKLRGVTVEGKANVAIQKIAQVVGGELGDTLLAGRITFGLEGDVFDYSAT
jgi:hypothetical protein